MDHQEIQFRHKITVHVIMALSEVHTTQKKRLVDVCGTNTLFNRNILTSNMWR